MDNIEEESDTQKKTKLDTAYYDDRAIQTKATPVTKVLEGKKKSVKSKTIKERKD